jgi:hypothetical protein
MPKDRESADTLCDFAPLGARLNSMEDGGISELKVVRKACWALHMAAILSFGFRVPRFELPNLPGPK